MLKGLKTISENKSQQFRRIFAILRNAARSLQESQHKTLQKVKMEGKNIKINFIQLII